MGTFSVGFSFELVADVVLGDGSKHRVGPFGPRDLIEFERHFQVPSTLLSGMVRTEWIAFLAYTQLARRGAVSGDFDAFWVRMDDLKAEVNTSDEAGDEEEEPGPVTEHSRSGSP